MKMIKTTKKAIVTTLAATFTVSLFSGCSPEVISALNTAVLDAAKAQQSAQQDANDNVDETGLNANGSSTTTPNDLNKKGPQNKGEKVQIDDFNGGEEGRPERPEGPGFKPPVRPESRPEKGPETGEHTDHKGEPCAHAIVRLRWGQPKLNNDVAKGTTWNGKISVTNGKIRLLKTIRFEGKDHMRPTGSPSSIAWTSFTKPHWDGVEAMIVAAPNGPEPMITVHDGFDTKTWAMHELAGLNDLKLPADEMGNYTQIRGKLLPPRPDQCGEFEKVRPFEEGDVIENDETNDEPVEANQPQDDKPEMDKPLEDKPEPAKEDDCGKYHINEDGSVMVSTPDGEERTLQADEYTLNEDGSITVLKEGEPDTGATVTPPPCE